MKIAKERGKEKLKPQLILLCHPYVKINGKRKD